MNKLTQAPGGHIERRAWFSRDRTLAVEFNDLFIEVAARIGGFVCRSLTSRSRSPVALSVVLCVRSR
jgi:hypothetical protein